MSVSWSQSKLPRKNVIFCVENLIIRKILFYLSKKKKWRLLKSKIATRKKRPGAKFSKSLVFMLLNYFVSFGVKEDLFLRLKLTQEFILFLLNKFDFWKFFFFQIWSRQHFSVEPF